MSAYYLNVIILFVHLDEKAIDLMNLTNAVFLRWTCYIVHRQLCHQPPMLSASSPRPRPMKGTKSSDDDLFSLGTVSIASTMDINITVNIHVNNFIIG